VTRPAIAATKVENPLAAVASPVEMPVAAHLKNLVASHLVMSATIAVQSPMANRATVRRGAVVPNRRAIAPVAKRVKAKCGLLAAVIGDGI
tara:strand:- start:20668 stop:20940 length:273 start_codon:yes stop_codon:yes gene_type:complete